MTLCLPQYITSEDVLLPFTGNVNFDHLVKVCPISPLYSYCFSPPLQLISLWGDNFGSCKFSTPYQNFPLDSASFGDASLFHLYQWLPNDNFPTLAFPPHLLVSLCHSAETRDFPFIIICNSGGLINYSQFSFSTCQKSQVICYHHFPLQYTFHLELVILLSTLH